MLLAILVTYLLMKIRSILLYIILLVFIRCMTAIETEKLL